MVEMRQFSFKYTIWNEILNKYWI